MSKRLHYVCDRCGHYFEREPASMMECPVESCQHTALWEFDRKQPALDHSFGIKHLFRGVR